MNLVTANLLNLFNFFPCQSLFPNNIFLLLQLHYKAVFKDLLCNAKII